MNNTKKIKSSKEDMIFDILNYIFLGCFLVIIIYPLYFVVIASISEPIDVLNGNVIFYPVGFSLEGYARIFEDITIWRGYLNTIIYTVLATILNVFLTLGIAYPLSRSYFSGRKILLFFLMFTMYFQGGMIPTYMLVSDLGLRNTVAVMVIMGAVNVFNVIITRTFLESNIPSTLEEAATIDGCSQIRFFSRMVLPLSGSIVAVLILYYGIAHWNDYMTALLYLTDEEMYPLQMIIRDILITASSEAESMDPSMQESLMERVAIAESVKYGVIIISSIPVLIIYPFLQDYFTKSVLVGSVKG